MYRKDITIINRLRSIYSVELPKEDKLLPLKHSLKEYELTEFWNSYDTSNISELKGYILPSDPSPKRPDDWVPPLTREVRYTIVAVKSRKVFAVKDKETNTIVSPWMDEHSMYRYIMCNYKNIWFHLFNKVNL